MGGEEEGAPEKAKLREAYEFGRLLGDWRLRVECEELRPEKRTVSPRRI